MSDHRTLPVCTWCGSQQVTFDGSCSYNPLTEQMELNGSYDSTDCQSCGGECSILLVWCDGEGNKKIITEPNAACPLCPGQLKPMKVWADGNDPEAAFVCCDLKDDHVFLISAREELDA